MIQPTTRRDVDKVVADGKIKATAKTMENNSLPPSLTAVH